MTKGAKSYYGNGAFAYHPDVSHLPAAIPGKRDTDLSWAGGNSIKMIQQYNHHLAEIRENLSKQQATIAMITGILASTGKDFQTESNNPKSLLGVPVDEIMSKVKFYARPTHVSGFRRHGAEAWEFHCRGESKPLTTDGKQYGTIRHCDYHGLEYEVEVFGRKYKFEVDEKFRATNQQVYSDFNVADAYLGVQVEQVRTALLREQSLEHQKHTNLKIEGLEGDIADINKQLAELLQKIIKESVLTEQKIEQLESAIKQLEDAGQTSETASKHRHFLRPGRAIPGKRRTSIIRHNAADQGIIGEEGYQ